MKVYKAEMNGHLLQVFYMQLFIENFLLQEIEEECSAYDPSCSLSAMYDGQCTEKMNLLVLLPYGITNANLGRKILGKSQYMVDELYLA